MTPAEEQELRVRAQDRLDLKRQADERLAKKAGQWEVGKTAGAVARGTGEGIASTIDLAPQAGQYLWEVGKNLWEEGHGRNYERKAVSSPLTDLYNENMPAAPEGYEKVNDVASIFGPAALEIAASMGTATPAVIAQVGARAAAKKLLTGTAKAAGRSARHTGAGIVGSEVGGALGEKLGGETGKEIGSFAGGVFGGPASVGGIKKGVKSAKDAVVYGAKHPVQGLANLAAGTGGVAGLLSGKLPIDTSTAGLLAAAVPVGAGIFNAGKKAVTNPLAEIERFGGGVPPAITRLGTSQVYEDSPLRYDLHKQGVGPLVDASRSGINSIMRLVR